MIQVLGLTQYSQKTEIEPSQQTVSTVAEANEHAAELERVRFLRNTVKFETRACARSPHETEIAPLPQDVSKFAEGNGNTAELDRVTSARKTLMIQSMDFAQSSQETESAAPPETVNKCAEDIESSAELEQLTSGKYSMVQTLDLVDNFQKAGIELAPHVVSEVAESAGYATETEPPLQSDSKVAEGVSDAIEPGRVTHPAENSIIQSAQKTAAESPPQTVSNVSEAIENAAELRRVTPAGEISGIQATVLALDPQETAIEPPPQAVSKVAEGIENATELDRIPLEEINVEPLSRIVFHTDPRGVAADRFRFLRMRIRELSNAGKLKSLLVTSALSLDGKSTVSLNLATALAERGQNAVLLLEADLYHPTLAQRLGLKAGPGLAECLASGLAPLSAVRRVEPLGWYFLPAGSQLANPSDLLHGDGFAKIMQTLLPHFKWIVIDSPPVVPVADALALARQADASLLVVRAGQTPSDAVEAAIESLGAKHVMGVILNGVEGLHRLYSKYNKYYAAAT